MSMTLAGITLPDPISYDITLNRDGEIHRAGNNYTFVSYSTLPIRRVFTLEFRFLTDSDRANLTSAFSSAATSRVQMVLGSITCYVRALDNASLRFKPDTPGRWQATLELTEVP